MIRSASLARVGRIGLWLVLAALVAVIFNDLFAVPDSQDALQYRLNLETGAYSDENLNSLWAAMIYLATLYLTGVDDIFWLIGLIIAFTYSFSALKLRLAPWRSIVFFVLLATPLMHFNYTQLLRQGFASALLLVSLMSVRNYVRSSGLVLASMIHPVYLPFALLVFIRPWIIGRCTTRGLVDQGRIDKIMFAVIPVAAVLLMLCVDAHTFNKYFELDLENIKRLIVSIPVAYYVWLTREHDPDHLAVFTRGFAVAYSVLIPFAEDFTRISSAFFPFMIFTAIKVPRSRRALQATLICMVLAAYIAIQVSIKDPFL